MGQGIASVFMFFSFFFFFSGLYYVIKHIWFTLSEHEKCTAIVSNIIGYNEKRTKADVELTINKEEKKYLIPHFNYSVNSNDRVKIGSTVNVIWAPKKNKAISSDTLKEGIKRLLLSILFVALFFGIAFLVVSLSQ